MRAAILPLVFLVGCQGCGESESPQAGGGGVGGSGGGGPIVEPVGGSSECDDGTADCDGDAGNGCEVPTDSDPAHCGSCVPCGVGTCVGGVCQSAQVLVDGIPTVANIATDGSSLFFASGGHAATLYFDGSLLSIPVTGAAEPDVLIGGLSQFTPEAVALDGDNVVFSSIGTQAGDGADGFVGRIAKSGGAFETVAASQRYAVQLVVNGGEYSWVASGSWSGDFLNGALRSFDGVATSNTLVEPENRPSRLFIDSTHVYWTSQGTPDADPPDGAIRRRTIEGGPIETLANGLDRATAVLVAGGNVYYGVKGAIRFAPVDAPDEVADFSETMDTPAIFATDGVDLYWTEAGSLGRVVRKPLAGGPAVVLAENINVPYGIVLDEANAYFTQRGSGIDDGAVWFIPK